MKFQRLKSGDFLIPSSLAFLDTEKSLQPITSAISFAVSVGNVL